MMNGMKLRFPEGIDTETFLRDYWQKRPLLMRGALTEYDFPLEPEELAGLACEEEIESRLVIGHDRYKRVFDLVKDFGTSESPKSTRSSTTHWCPGRPGQPAFRHNIASSLRLHTGLPYDWTPRSDAPLGSPLAPSARRVSRVASRLPGTTRLRFALHGGQRRWELHHGPFDESRFSELPESRWTLLVQDVDKYLPEVARLLEPFRFIPSWRFDDVMISYAVPGGSVGPHIDTYDVFLVQGMGRRRWQIQPHPTRDALIPDLPVRILSEFEPEQEWVVEPGDVLYLPPGVAHWGIAEEACMSWSVGLRAPSHQEMLDSFTNFLLERMPEAEHYRDPPLPPAKQPARIPADVVPHTFNELDRWLQDERLRQRWFGSFVTEVKAHLAIEPPAEPLSKGEILHHLRQGGLLKRHPFSHFAWMETGAGECLLFACGDIYETSGLSPDLLETLCSADAIDEEALTPCIDDDSFLNTLTELVNLGYLELAHE